MSGRGSGDPGHPAGLFPVPGDGVLARRGNLILLCSLSVSHLADRLLDLLEQTADAGGDGRQFADAVAAVVEQTDAQDGPAVLAFGPAGPGVAVTVSGGAWADVTTAAGTARVEAGHPGMLLLCVLRSPVSGVRGGLSPGDNGAASTDRFSRLEAGTVRAGGLSFYQAGPGQPAAGPVPAGPVAAGPVAAGPVAAEPVAPEPVAAEPVPAEPGAAEAVPLEKAGQQAAASGPPAGAEPVPESTAAWVPQDMPVAATGQAEGQATELWTPPPGSGPQDQPGQPAEMPAAGSGAGTADELEREVTVAPEPFEPGPPAPQAEPYSSGQPFEAVLLGGPAGGGVEAEPRQPLAKIRELPPGTSSYVSAGPIIQGVYCKNGHFDDPEARFCAVCGISMNQQTLVPRPGERPPLGVLLMDDGSVFQLDSDYVVGREPSLDASVAAGQARPLRVADESGIVSRVHARVALDGWRVLVTDLGSANGTRVFLPGQPADQQLVPQVPIVLAAGSQVDLGGRGFRYESHRGR